MWFSFQEGVVLKAQDWGHEMEEVLGVWSRGQRMMEPKSPLVDQSVNVLIRACHDWKALDAFRHLHLSSWTQLRQHGVYWDR